MPSFLSHQQYYYYECFIHCVDIVLDEKFFMNYYFIYFEFLDYQFYHFIFRLMLFWHRNFDINVCFLNYLIFSFFFLSFYRFLCMVIIRILKCEYILLKSALRRSELRFIKNKIFFIILGEITFCVISWLYKS